MGLVMHIAADAVHTAALHFPVELNFLPVVIVERCSPALARAEALVLDGRRRITAYRAPSEGRRKS